MTEVLNTEVTLKTKWLVFVEGVDLLSRKKDYTNKEISTLIKTISAGKVEVLLAKEYSEEEVTNEAGETETVEVETKRIGLLGTVKDVIKFIETFTKKEILADEKATAKILKTFKIEEEATVKGKFVTETWAKFKKVEFDVEDTTKVVKVLNELNTVTYEFITSLFEVVTNEETGETTIEATTKFEYDSEAEKTKKVNIKKEDKEKAKQVKFFTELLTEKGFNKLFK